MPKNSIGKKGEEEAQKYLKKIGYIIISTNFRSRFGEIDIIALDLGCTVFIEVKSRSTELFGSPAESIIYSKVRKLIKTAQFFQVLHPKLPKNIRFDAIEIFYFTNQPVRINHIKNITI